MVLSRKNQLIHSSLWFALIQQVLILNVCSFRRYSFSIQIFGVDFLSCSFVWFLWSWNISLEILNGFIVVQFWTCLDNQRSHSILNFATSFIYCLIGGRHAKNFGLLWGRFHLMEAIFFICWLSLDCVGRDFILRGHSLVCEDDLWRLGVFTFCWAHMLTVPHLQWSPHFIWDNIKGCYSQKGSCNCNTLVFTPFALNVYDVYIVINRGVELKEKGPLLIYRSMLRQLKS